MELCDDCPLTELELLGLLLLEELLGDVLLCDDCPLTELELLGELEVLLGELLLCEDCDDEDWSLLTELLVPGVVCELPEALGEDVAVPASGVWLCGGGVVEVADGVELVVLLGLATLEFDWPLVLLDDGSCELLDDWSGLLVVADPATPPVVEDGLEVELCAPDMLELELGEATLPEVPAALF